ncbi:hypothetical protein ACMYSP_00240 [Klebsiella sp. R390]|uniref:hypothetical protein n=1 Tax=Klebsiella sp. R390 TaxID=2755400 RepID=UPI003DA93440
MQYTQKNASGGNDGLVKLQARVAKDSAEYVRRLAFHREQKKQDLVNQIIQDYMSRNPLPI